MRMYSLVLCLILALAAPATVFAGASARVLSVTPDVRYSLGSAGEALAVKMDVPIKAVVVSDATGKAQLMFPDDSTLSIAPDTRISLAEYVDAEQEENIVLDLVSGTARIITGESNRRNPQAFTVNTPQASIGIRGTLVTIQAAGDVTRVYLSETSGKGVSVRNLHTGQVMELRKPGTIINVGAGFMEERKAQSEEAAAFSAALRGKSRAEIERATARAQGEIRRAAAATLAPEGTLPPTGLADPVQVAAMSNADMLTQATLVANNTPKPVELPDVVPAVTDVPQVPDVTPITPEVPNAPDPVLPDPPVQDYVITEFAQVAGATFKGTGDLDYYSDDIYQRTYTATPEFTFPASAGAPTNNIFSINMSSVSTFLAGFYCDFGKVKMELNMDGNFVMQGNMEINDSDESVSMNGRGKFTSSSTGVIEELNTFRVIPSYKINQRSELTAPINISK